MRRSCRGCRARGRRAMRRQPGSSTAARCASTTLGGSVWVAFTKDDYATAKSALVGRVSADKRESERAGRGSLGSADPVESDPVRYVPYDQRLYDALMHLFRLGSEPASGRRRAVRPRVVVHAPLELLTGCSGVPGVAEIQGVGPVSAEVARRLACDANVVLSVEARDGSILDQGRARRDPTVAQRVEIARRDKGCRFPGCSFTEFTDIHHVHPLDPWRRDEPRQPGHTVRPASQGRARAGMGDEGRRQLGDVLHQPAWPGEVSQCRLRHGEGLCRASAPRGVAPMRR